MDWWFTGLSCTPLPLDTTWTWTGVSSSTCKWIGETEEYRGGHGTSIIPSLYFYQSINKSWSQEECSNFQVNISRHLGASSRSNTIHPNGTCKIGPRCWINRKYVKTIAPGEKKISRHWFGARSWNDGYSKISSLVATYFRTSSLPSTGGSTLLSTFLPR